MRTFFLISLCLIILKGPQALASELRLGTDTNFVVDNNNINDTANALHTFIDAYAHLNLGMRSNIFLSTGFVFTQRKAAVSATSVGNLTSNHPYAGLTIGFCGDKLNCAISAYYSPYVRAQYSESGSSAETWLGSSYQAKLSLRPRLSESFAITLSLTYFAANYTVKGASTSVSSAEKFQTSTIMPTIGFQYIWKSEDRKF